MAAKPRPARKAKAPARAKPAATRTPILEWAAAAIGLLIVLGVCAVLGAEILRGDHTAPRFSVETRGVEPVPGGYLLKFRVHNTGHSSAGEVEVEGKLTSGGGVAETTSATFDFIADQSSRDGGLYFSSDPTQGDVVLAAKGYVEP